MLQVYGLTVLRVIPWQWLAGIASGLYRVHGGVIRDQGGRILAHLALGTASQLDGPLRVVSDLINVTTGVHNTLQLKQLSRDVETTLNLGLATTALSGLSLTTSLAGFAYLGHRLNQIEGTIKEIKGWLRSETEGQLRAAIKDYAHASQTEEVGTRRQLLLSAKTMFTSLAHHYRSQSAALTSLADVQLCEEYFVLAALGAVSCASDLGLHAPARKELADYHGEWAKLARTHLHRLLKLDDPSHLLDSRYVKGLPTRDLIALLNFAKQEQKDIGWIDQLRTGFRTATSLTSGIRPVEPAAAAYARKLVARNEVLDSYISHFGFLAEHRVSASDFASHTLGELSRTGEPLLVIVPRSAAAEADAASRRS
jgi:hypothetical protein